MPPTSLTSQPTSPTFLPSLLLLLLPHSRGPDDPASSDPGNTSISPQGFASLRGSISSLGALRAAATATADGVGPGAGVSTLGGGGGSGVFGFSSGPLSSFTREGAGNATLSFGSSSYSALFASGAFGSGSGILNPGPAGGGTGAMQPWMWHQIMTAMDAGVATMTVPNTEVHLQVRKGEGWGEGRGIDSLEGGKEDERMGWRELERDCRGCGECGMRGVRGRFQAAASSP
jgi:hypothetical protein